MSRKRLIALLAMMGISASLLLVGFTRCLLSAEPQTQRRGCGENLNQKGLDIEIKASQLFRDGVQGKDTAKIKEAMRLYEEVLKLEPRLISPYVNLSLHYDAGENNPEKALAILKKGLAQCSNEPDLYFALGAVYTSLRQYRDAVESYEKALKLGYQGPQPSLYSNIGNNYARLEGYSNAIFYLKKAIELDPNKFDAYQSLAVVYYRKGEKQNSRETMKKLQALDPKGPFGQWASDALKQLEKEQ